MIDKTNIDALVASKTTSKELLAVWQELLDEQIGTPPNQRHFDCIDMILQKVAPPFYVLLQAEEEARLAQQLVDIAASMPKPEVPTPAWTKAKLISDMRSAIWAVTHAVGEDECADLCKKAIMECVVDLNSDRLG